MKYKVSTVSTTASGVVPIKGATKYPGEPTIYFTREAWVKQCHLVDKCPMEVGWFALVDYNEEFNSFTITELVIPCQEVTAAETDIGKEDLADAAIELIEAGKDTSKMYAWFHSHVNMTVSPSGQDEFQVEDFLEDLADQPEVPAFIRGIQNKAGDLKLDVYYIQHGIAYQNVEFYVIHDDDPQWHKDIEAEILTKVTTRTYNTYNYGSGGNRSAAGKSQNGSANPNSANAGRAYGGGGYGGYDDTYDNPYDPYGYDDFDSYSGAVEVGTSVDDNEGLLTALEELTIDDQAFEKLQLIYTATRDNTEVFQTPEGKLVICETAGDMYDYEDYTAIFGEIDAVGGTTPAHRAVIV